MVRSLAGTRIREVRRRAGLTQSALAKAAGISPSYLNLIEHNRRSAAGKVLLSIANALDAKPSELSDSGDTGLVAELREAVSPESPSEPPEEFIGRFPYWSRQTARLFRQTRDQGQAIAALSDRLTHDPYIAESFHGMLSNITAIRSTASILSNSEDLPGELRSRFSETLHSESLRLSHVAEALANYLAGSASTSDNPVTPEEAFDQFLERNDYFFHELDILADYRSAHASTIVEIAELTEHLVRDPLLPEGDARQVAADYLKTYSRDAMDMPLDPFFRTAKECSFDPIAISHVVNQPVSSVLRRLVTLKRPGYDMPSFGLIVGSASGHPLYRRPLPGFPMPRHGNACTLWPLFAALSQPERPLLATLIHDNGARFATISVAQSHTQAQLGRLPDMRTSMLIVAEEESPFATPPLEIDAGTSCQLCSRRTCLSRAESPILG